MTAATQDQSATSARTQGASVVPSVAVALLFWAVASVLAIRFGSAGGAEWEMMAQLRLPRVVMASAIGAALSVAGATLQALFANPLCEPYTLGISSGAALRTAQRAAERLERGNVVVLFADGGWKYLSTELWSKEYEDIEEEIEGEVWW